MIARPEVGTRQADNGRLGRPRRPADDDQPLGVDPRSVLSLPAAVQAREGADAAPATRPTKQPRSRRRSRLKASGSNSRRETVAKPAEKAAKPAEKPPKNRPTRATAKSDARRLGSRLRSVRFVAVFNSRVMKTALCRSQLLCAVHRLAAHGTSARARRRRTSAAKLTLRPNGALLSFQILRAMIVASLPPWPRPTSSRCGSCTPCRSNGYGDMAVEYLKIRRSSPTCRRKFATSGTWRCPRA